MAITEKLFVGDKPVEKLTAEEAVKEIYAQHAYIKFLKNQVDQYVMIIKQLQANKPLAGKKENDKTNA